MDTRTEIATRILCESVGLHPQSDVVRTAVALADELIAELVRTKPEQQPEQQYVTLCYGDGSVDDPRGIQPSDSAVPAEWDEPDYSQLVSAWNTFASLSAESNQQEFRALYSAIKEATGSTEDFGWILIPDRTRQQGSEPEPHSSKGSEK
jgi:hypothetical protein